MAPPIQVLPTDLLTVILMKGFSMKELLQISGVSKAFRRAARGIKDVELEIGCMTCASREDCQSTKAYGRFLAQAQNVKTLRLRIVDRHCDSCKSAGNSCKLSEVFPAKWIESLRDTLEDFTYHDPYAFIISEERFDIPPFDENELTFTDFMLESLSRCSNLKRLKLCTRKVFRHQGCSWQLSFPNNLSELRLSNCSGDQLVGVLNQVSLTQACPFLKSLSLQGRLEGTLCLNFERLESLNLDLASRAEALRIDLTSTPSLQRISLRFEEEHRKNDDFEEDRFTLVVRHKLLSLTALDLINATWEQTVQLLDNSPSLQDFTFNQGVLGLDDDEMEINLTVMLQKVAISNPLLEYLKVETSKLPPSGLMERGPSLRHLRHLRFCNLDIFDLLELTKNLHSLLPNSPLLEKVAVEVYVMLDSERSEETDGLIDSMNSFFKLQRTFPGVIFELENMER